MSKGRKAVAVDMDGVIAEYHGWKGPEHVGPPLEGAREGLQALRDAGYRILIFTTRGERRTQQYLDEHDLLYDEIFTGFDDGVRNPAKPMATAYLDDRAVRFRGDWERAVAEIIALRPWYRQSFRGTPPATAEGVSRIYYYKAVRDRIPEIISDSGAEPRWRKVGKAPFRRLLIEKLREETDELERCAPGACAGELADLLELCLSLARIEGIAPDELERLRAEKAERRGAFRDRYVLDWVDSPA